MNEEEKKAIEKFIKKCNKFDESVEIKGVSVGEEYRTLETVCKALDLVEKLQKENEELKTTNKIIINKEIRNGQPTLSGTRLTIIDILLLMIDFVRDYEKEFRANYADISVEQIILVFDYFINNSISVQIVKDKIEEEKLPLTIVGGRRNKKTLEYGIKLGRRQALQELIEERGEKNHE